MCLKVTILPYIVNTISVIKKNRENLKIIKHSEEHVISRI